MHESNRLVQSAVGYKGHMIDSPEQQTRNDEANIRLVVLWRSGASAHPDNRQEVGGGQNIRNDSEVITEESSTIAAVSACELSSCDPVI